MAPGGPPRRPLPLALPYAYVGNAPTANVDPDGRGIISKVVKAARVAYRGARGGFSRAMVAEEFAGNVRDAQALVSPGSTPLQRVGAGLSLASEALPVSVDDVRSGYRAVRGLLARGDDVADAARSTGRSTDFIVTEGGTAVPTSQSRMTKVELELTRSTLRTMYVVGAPGSDGGAAAGGHRGPS